MFFSRGGAGLWFVTEMADSVAGKQLPFSQISSWAGDLGGRGELPELFAFVRICPERWICSEIRAERSHGKGKGVSLVG